MTDISDIATYFKTVIAGVVYPNGPTQPSAIGMDARIFEGWPLPDQLDLDLSGRMVPGPGQPPVDRVGGPLANVSVFPMLGTNVTPYQLMNKTHTIIPAQVGMTVSVVGSVITLGGTLQSAEFLTLVCDDAHVFSSTGTSIANLIANLAALVAVNYPTVSFTATTLTVPFGHDMTVRQGGKGVQGRVIHRQRQSVMVSVWAPTPAARSAFSKPIDVEFKKHITVTMADTSEILVCYNRTNIVDEYQSATVYRRDLIYDVEYGTLEEFDAYTITSVTASIANPSNTAIATAIT